MEDRRLHDPFCVPEGPFDSKKTENRARRSTSFFEVFTRWLSEATLETAKSVPFATAFPMDYPTAACANLCKYTRVRCSSLKQRKLRICSEYCPNASPHPVTPRVSMGRPLERPRTVLLGSGQRVDIVHCLRPYSSQANAESRGQRLCRGQQRCEGLAPSHPVS